jgi:hypothetical protein
VAIERQIRAYERKAARDLYVEAMVDVRVVTELLSDAFSFAVR